MRRIAVKNNRLQSLCLLAGALLFLSLAGCATNPVTGKSNFVLFDESDELQMGKNSHPQIIEQYGRYNDEAVQRYVQRVGEKLAKVSHRPELNYHFTVLDSPVVNAFALPGGYIYITRGLMAYLNSEAELAAVLGHEIGHVTARHGVRQQSASQAANLGYTLGAILIPELRTAASQNVFNAMGGALLSGYGRDHELESDRLGSEYLARAGYAPQAMIDVIRVLKDQESYAAAQAKKLGQQYQGYHGLFASHPDNDTRLQQVVAEADKYAVNQDVVWNQQAYLAQLDGMTYGDSETQGIRSGNHFYHKAMGFALSFPEGWHINNNPSSLQAIAGQGDAVIELAAGPIGKAGSPQQFIQQQMKLALRSGRVFNSHGLQGYTGLAEQQQGQAVRVAVVFLHQQAFIFLAASKNPAAFNQYDAAFLHTINSLHALGEDEQQQAQALKLHVVKVGANDSYQVWAAQSRISNNPLDQLRLLNGDYPQGELQAGELAKQVR